LIGFSTAVPGRLLKQGFCEADAYSLTWHPSTEGLISHWPDDVELTVETSGWSYSHHFCL